MQCSATFFVLQVGADECIDLATLNKHDTLHTHIRQAASQGGLQAFPGPICLS